MTDPPAQDRNDLRSSTHCLRIIVNEEREHRLYAERDPTAIGRGD